MSTPGILRSDLVQLGGLLERDVTALFRQVGKDPARSLDTFHDALPPMADRYGMAAGAISADWYDEARDRAEVGGRFIAEPTEIRDVGVHALVGWAASTATDDTSLRSLMIGGMQRRMMNYSRETIIDSAIADPRAKGWQRTASGGCDFCQMLAGRGAIYTRKTVDFASHDDCKCAAVAAFSDRPTPVRPYQPSTRWRTEAQKEANQKRVREWLRANLDEDAEILPDAQTRAGTTGNRGSG